MAILAASGGTIAPPDVPGLADWILDQGAVSESTNPSAADLLDHATEDCPDKSLITPEIHHMASLLRQFADQVQKAKKPALD